MTQMSLAYVPLTVDDVDAAIAFYRDAVGLSLLNDVPGDGHRWVSMGFDRQPGLALVLSDPSAGRSPDDGDALHRLIAKGVGPGPLVLATDDLDAAFARIRDTGAEIVQEPTRQPWGVRDCAFRDPAGNMVRINEGGWSAGSLDG